MARVTKYLELKEIDRSSENNIPEIGHYNNNKQQQRKNEKEKEQEKEKKRPCDV